MQIDSEIRTVWVQGRQGDHMTRARRWGLWRQDPLEQVELFPSRWRQQGLSERRRLGVGWAQRLVLIRAPMIRTAVNPLVSVKSPLFHNKAAFDARMSNYLSGHKIPARAPVSLVLEVPLFFLTPKRGARLSSLIGRPSDTAGKLPSSSAPVDRSNWRNLNSIPSRFNFPTIKLPIKNLPSYWGRGCGPVGTGAAVTSPSAKGHHERGR